MKYFASLFLLLLLTPKLYASDKMDLPLKMLFAQPPVGRAILGKAIVVQKNIEQADVIIKSRDPGLTATALESAGGTARTVLGNIMTAFVPIDILPILESRNEVEGIEAAQELRLLNDSSRANTGVDSLQSGTADGTAYSGRNVVVGIVDTGLDYTRDDFKSSDGQTRVQYLRFQTARNGSFSITECVKQAITDGACAIANDNDSTIGHGSHVTGIAAGSDATYKGVAPAADIMLVRNDFEDDLAEGGATFSSGILDGVAAIFDKAGTIDKAAVINISQGTHIGAHDDTSLMEQGLNSSVTGGKNSAGRAIAVAAGNEHVVENAVPAGITNLVGGIHAAFEVASGQSKAARLWALQVSSSAGGNDQRRTPLIIDVWFGSDQSPNCSIAAKAYGFGGGNFLATNTANASAAIADMALSSNASNEASSSDRKLAVSISTDSSDSQNGKPRAIVSYGPGALGTWDDVVTDLSSGYFIDVIIRANGGTCSGDMWVEGALAATYTHFLKGIDTGYINVSGSGDYTFTTGNSEKTVGIPGTASGVITVGAYLQEKPFGSGGSTWTVSNGTTYNATDPASDSSGVAGINGGTVGLRTPFSSIGPTADGRQKPDILAPGDPVTSVSPTGYFPTAAVEINSTHYKSQGTSQSSPHVAGIVALLFQKNSCLTAAQVKTALTSSADSNISGYDATKDGSGKAKAVPAMAGVEIPATQCYTGTGDISDGSSESSGGGGCGGMIVPINPTSNNTISLVLLLLPGIALASRRW